MKLYLATDHAGFELKEKVKNYLQKNNYEVEDFGAYVFDKNDDYPDYISKASEAVSKDPQNSKAIIFGGSGQGEAIAANKYKNIRAVVFYGESTQTISIDFSGKENTNPFELIKLTRKHNDANILSLGARFLKEEDAIKAIAIWLKTPFSNEERHIRRIEKIQKLENLCVK